MKSGRELDALVAEKVMGFDAAYSVVDKPTSRAVIGGDDYCAIKGCTLYPLPRYSTDIAAAWKVVDKIGLINLTNGPDGWFCRFGKREGITITQFDGKGATAPEAICRCALHAFGVQT